ncbi:uncharacterized protein PITG_10325 [Phytophthora infestans T30-4]|uniref:SCP domain-containing protein n=1 Tax=Phytophthora infestans (strain T30-4) TaxID=403677 RepID=D0NF23_PHYIT|nr:uncharacterized protein PITG_10325 [Phytophthora infestans T30-4]EEY56812.1 conserved hypothetical protein [Phytophthora infestans T30-4]|eukprot:XP_002902140.1 conserved hypothetical protein [Phytophthora infestans T30-4]
MVTQKTRELPTVRKDGCGVRNVLVCASMALVATVSAFPADGHHRTLQAVNFRQEMLDNINAARKKEGLDELCLNEMLMDAAQIQSNDMADNNFIKSTGSDGTTPKERAAAQGFKAEAVTEIVGAGYRTVASVVAAWTKASTAKSTIFGKVNVMGPGYTFDKTRKYVHFWAVDFSTGECGNGTASGGPATSGDASGSVELPSSGSDAPKSSDDSGSDAPAPAGRGADTPAVTPAPAGSGAETPASGSGDPPAATARLRLLAAMTIPRPVDLTMILRPADLMTKNLQLLPLQEAVTMRLRPVPLPLFLPLPPVPLPLPPVPLLLRPLLPLPRQVDWANPLLPLLLLRMSLKHLSKHLLWIYRVALIRTRWLHRHSRRKAKQRDERVGAGVGVAVGSGGLASAAMASAAMAVH